MSNVRLNRTDVATRPFIHSPSTSPQRNRGLLPRSMRVLVLLLVAGGQWTLDRGLAQAAENVANGATRSLEQSFEQRANPFLQRYCVRCHNADKMTSGIRRGPRMAPFRRGCCCGLPFPMKVRTGPRRISKFHCASCPITQATAALDAPGRSRPQARPRRAVPRPRGGTQKTGRRRVPHRQSWEEPAVSRPLPDPAADSDRCSWPGGLG
jgi:hypothetical protein